MNKKVKVVIDKLQNEKAAKQCCVEIVIGKEYEFPLNGICAFYRGFYQLEDDNGKRLNLGGGFPIGDAHDAKNNKYDIRLEKIGITAYLKVNKNR